MADAVTSQSGTLIGLIGQGIGGSRSPALHMVEADAQGMRYIYRLIDLDVLGRTADDLPFLLEAAIAAGFDGLNITHPCKQRIIPLLDEVDPIAAEIGAVNTVRIVNGRTKGYNTDQYGFRSGIERELGSIAGQKVVQLGAGGAGAATASAVLMLEAARLEIADVDSARAEQLAASLASRFGGDRVGAVRDVVAAIGAADGLVHATPTGMAAHPGLPLDGALLRPDLWVAEIVYFPLETELLRRARATGARTVHGGYMAVFQAVGAFEIFTDRKADSERMMRHFASFGQDVAA
ncbi:shikimate dehydrogenase [Sphingomonas naphthae]|uniref:Shikimate dehydrogenase n=1 Tax=Sphingomonas naphthae TaxID=1813468 RepID=A0ABY7TIL1_9SPHN|nr:shikimate dehydrogenase [Sphingomonas naphthae]WCT72868.1 shikimate dehydrogenase [Sphingomonas naphthae]